MRQPLCLLAGAAFLAIGLAPDPAGASRSERPQARSAPAPEVENGITRAELTELPERPEGPLAVFAQVEEAWRAGDVDVLLELMDPKERIHLSFVQGGPRGGYFNRDQAYFLLQDMFSYAPTERFEFETYWNLDSEGRSPYAIAVRELRMTDGSQHEDRVYLSLRRRGDDWWVGEIRTIDR